MTTFAPHDEPITLTKERAAARQVQIAVTSLESGLYDVATTLAGAAEGMLDGDPSIELSTALRNDPAAIAEFGRPTWVQVTNLERDWLKHKTERFPTELEFRLDDASMYVYRAMRKLPPDLVTEEMLAFEKWYRARVHARVKSAEATSSTLS
ncbi:hypothetical protein CDO28_01420 [Sinorhizobium meliloti]|uniref:hypothetical protein n=1 Tax=Rhizobium meliloti TaxID=382 RepID=UPI000B49A52A|nr:hypothetical protein [Sinorhizobium meliloti]ASP70348.1 hypothetical protein CDO28_01420 [Sinorhizobium meliloti]MQW52461.1 hypothetical protein [Sinorhizobium meliloti]